MTERLYYDDAYLADFSCTVLECRPAPLGYAARLDRSAFYPTSGGQPYDTGTLGGRQVNDVWADPTGEVWHLLDGPLEEGQAVEGHVDWARRFDHMQQHAGEHMLAGALYKALGGHTIGLHLGAQASTIDVELPDGQMRVPEETLLSVEATVNRQIQSDLPIRCYFPTPEELEAAPLRKPPSVREHIRLVRVGDVECVACGGTHPASSGQIGLVKILDARPSRGKMRVTFVCGMRAISDYQTRALASERAAALMSCAAEELPQAVSRTLERLHAAERALSRARLDVALARAERLPESAVPLPGGEKAVRAVLDGLDAAALREVAGHFTAGGLIALLASGAGEGATVLFAAPPGAKAHMGNLLSACARPLGGKGGGRADFAQGAGPGEAVLAAAISQLIKE